MAKFAPVLFSILAAVYLGFLIFGMIPAWPWRIIGLVILTGFALAPSFLAISIKKTNELNYGNHHRTTDFKTYLSGNWRNSGHNPDHRLRQKVPQADGISGDRRDSICSAFVHRGQGNPHS